MRIQTSGHLLSALLYVSTRLAFKYLAYGRHVSYKDDDYVLPSPPALPTAVAACYNVILN